jgi:hypothetical protein
MHLPSIRVHVTSAKIAQQQDPSNAAVVEKDEKGPLLVRLPISSKILEQQQRRDDAAAKKKREKKSPVIRLRLPSKRSAQTQEAQPSSSLPLPLASQSSGVEAIPTASVPQGTPQQPAAPPSPTKLSKSKMVTLPILSVKLTELQNSLKTPDPTAPPIKILLPGSAGESFTSLTDIGMDVGVVSVQYVENPCVTASPEYRTLLMKLHNFESDEEVQSYLHRIANQQLKKAEIRGIHFPVAKEDVDGDPGWRQGRARARSRRRTGKGQKNKEERKEA